MMIGEKTLALLNAQVGHELGAMTSYYALAAWFDDAGLKGFKDYYYAQAEEERVHGLKMLQFIVDSGGKLAIPAIPAPKADYSSAEEAVRAALEHEETVTRQIYALVDSAQSEADKQTEEFMRWFVAEQLEEVSSAHDVITLLEQSGGNAVLAQQFLKRG